MYNVITSRNCLEIFFLNLDTFSAFLSLYLCRIFFSMVTLFTLTPSPHVCFSYHLFYKWGGGTKHFHNYDLFRKNLCSWVINFFFASTVITLFLGKHFTPFYSHVSDTSCVWTLWFCMCGVNFFHPKLDYFIIGLVILCEEGLLLEANLPVVWMFLRNIFLRGTLRSDDCSVWEVLSLRFVWCVMCVWIVRDMDLSESAKCRLFECAMWYSEE